MAVLAAKRPANVMVTGRTSYGNNHRVPSGRRNDRSRDRPADGIDDIIIKFLCNGVTSLW